MIRFGHYQLDPAQGLRRGAAEVRLTPKALALLHYLAERIGQVVSKDEIFRAVWPGTVVSDSALSSCIQELRQALKDDARRPRFIETVHRRGFRFVAEGTRADLASPPSSPEESPLVGRESVLDGLAEAWARACEGARQVVFVSGEPGIGKTSVVRAFLTRAGGRDARAAWGQCIEHYGIGEPYQPLLEALARLCRQPGGERIVALLQQFAPTWIVQLPGVLAPEALASMARSASGATRERMLRELTEALEAITAWEPMVLVLEDLHWSDASTLDWIGAFAQRPEPARLLLLGTFRPGTAGSGHPLAPLTESLAIKGFSREIALAGLDEDAVVAWTALRFAAAGEREESVARLARMVHHRTAGNPLFVDNVLDDLVRRGLLVNRAGRWTLTTEAPDVDLGIPEDVQRMIQRQVDRLDATERLLLEVASVAGTAFSAASVAAGVGTELAAVETGLLGLARRQSFVRESGAVAWPDGTVAGGFEFLHALYRDAIDRSLPAGRRAHLHRLVGEREEAAYGARAPEIAAALAMHFEETRDTRRAVLYRRHAGENAQRRSAYKEARIHFERALALLENDPPGPARTEREIAMRIALGGVIMANDGWGAAGSGESYARARALCLELGETPQLFPALFGLWLFYTGRRASDEAMEIARELLDRARRSGDEALVVQAHHAAWATAFARGELDRALEHAEEGIRLHDEERDFATASVYGQHDPVVCAYAFKARTLALEGRTDEAVRTGEEGIALARRLDHPLSLAIALVFAGEVDRMRDDADGARERVEAVLAIARAQDLRLMSAWASTLEGWVMTRQGRPGEGVERMKAGLAEARATGSHPFIDHLLCILAAAMIQAGRLDEGRAVLDEAWRTVGRVDDCFFGADLHAVRAELLLATRSGPAAAEAETELARAIEVARGQGATLPALRAAGRLAALWTRQGREREAAALVAAVRGEHAPGHDTRAPRRA